MKNKKWIIREIVTGPFCDNDKELNKALADGWEPFQCKESVQSSGGIYYEVYLLKKQVTK